MDKELAMKNIAWYRGVATQSLEQLYDNLICYVRERGYVDLNHIGFDYRHAEGCDFVSASYAKVIEKEGVLNIALYSNDDWYDLVDYEYIVYNHDYSSILALAGELCGMFDK